MQSATLVIACLNVIHDFPGVEICLPEREACESSD